MPFQCCPNILAEGSHLATFPHPSNPSAAAPLPRASMAKATAAPFWPTPIVAAP
jgi:hypothetical protein